MKEKRVDIYFAEAGWYVLGLAGLSGTFLNEIIQDEPRLIVEVSTGLLSLGLFVSIRNRFLKAISLTKKSKHKHHKNE
jgi:hypothetical protein